MSRPAIDALREQRHQVGQLELLATSRWKENNLVFPSTVWTFLNSPNVTHRFQKLLEQYGFPRQRFHELRHATASILLAEGFDLFEVKEILGHSQISLSANLAGHLTRKLSEEVAKRIGAALSDDEQLLEVV